MTASQFVIDNILSVLGGAGVVVTALSTYLGKLLADRSLMREKGKLDRDLQRLKDDHAKELKLIETEFQLELLKKDQFHQISKSTYEKIFEKKIKIYTKLLDLKMSFKSLVEESHVTEVDDPTYEFYPYFTECRAIIERNKLYITKELSQKFDHWLDKASPYFKKANLAGNQAHKDPCADQDRYQNIIDAQNPIHANLIIDTMDELQAVFRQVDEDVAKIRYKIDNPEV